MIIYFNREFGGGRPESRRLLEEAFARYTGDMALAGELISKLKTGDQGKPYIDGFCHFSVSHTGCIWAVLIGESECGLDIQLGRGCNMQAIADRVYAEEDRAKLDAAFEREVCGTAEDLFFRIWTRREALAKALGGSAIKSDLPPVLGDRVSFGTRAWRIADIPAEKEIFSGRDIAEEKLYAALCFEDGSWNDDDNGPADHLLWEEI